LNRIEEILRSREVIDALLCAWGDSNPGAIGGHEEGGFIVKGNAGKFQAVRWPRGGGNLIDVPPHPNCHIGGDEILITFHTHPNTGSDYTQEPSQTDIRGVQNDPDLKSPGYLGELVISSRILYFIHRDGSVAELGRTDEMLIL
jgi:hypothetical protein